jgi:hypothetical protein
MSLFRRVVVVGVATCVTSGSALAAPCGRPDVDLSFPPSDAEQVPTNAGLAAHYASPALYDDEAVVLTDASGSEVLVDVRFDAIESMLHATPLAALTEGAYRVVWPGLRSVSSGGVGRGKTVSFSVSGAADAAPPRFAGLTAIEWDLSRDRDPCLDRLEDRFVFRLSLGQATDDAPSTLLQALVFETRSPTAGATGAATQIASRAMPESGVLEVRRPASAAGSTCFAAVTRDMVGQVSGGGEREVCATTKAPPFFEGCTLAAPAGSASRSTACLLVAFLGFCYRRRGASAASRASVLG